MTVDMSVEAARAYFEKKGDEPLDPFSKDPSTPNHCPLEWMLIDQGSPCSVVGIQYYALDAERADWILLPGELIDFVAQVDGRHGIKEYRWEYITGRLALELLDRVTGGK